ncbi:unnamed protein product [Discosporangium mesarthrocarpum]
MNRDLRARAPTALCMVKDRPSFQNTALTIVALVATVGGSALPFFQGGPETGVGAKTVRVVQEDGTEIFKGAMTSMSRQEIQKKLSQVPVFFLRESNGGVHTIGGEGQFFMAPEDAQAKLLQLGEKSDIKVSATTLDDIFYPLIQKRGPNSNPLGAEVSGKSDTSAQYRLIARRDQVAAAVKTAGNTLKIEEGSVPIWMADSLAFQGVGKIKVPLFTNLADLETSWARLREAGSVTEDSPKIQVSTIGEAVRRMEKGGGGNRMLEFFADMDAIEQAEKLF